MILECGILARGEKNLGGFRSPLKLQAKPLRHIIHIIKLVLRGGR